MISDRPYKKALTKEETIEEIIRNKGKQFNPILADLFIEVIREEK